MLETMTPQTSERPYRRHAWEIYAQSYDRILPVLPFYQEVVLRHIGAMLVPGVQNILDLGAGTGNVAIELARLHRHVTAVDISPDMLKHLRLKARGLSPDRLVVLERNAETLHDLSDGSFHGVSILLALFDMQNPRRALEEALRVLSSGGLLVITEPKASFKLQPLLDFVEHFLRTEKLYDELETHWERVLAANRAINPEMRHNRLTNETIRDELENRGFRILDMKDSHLGNCATVLARKS